MTNNINITEELKQLIEKNLPAATAGAMRDYIDEMELMKTTLSNTEEHLKVTEDSLHDKEQEITALLVNIKNAGDLKAREEAVTQREVDVDIRERDFSLELVRLELEETKKRQAAVEGLVTKVFGHPSVTVDTNKSVPVMTDGNGNVPYQSGSTYESTSETTKQTKE